MNAEQGIASSAANTGEEWLERAEHFISWYFRKHPTGEHTIEAVRVWSYFKGLDIPPEQRAWGLATRRAVANGIMKPTGGYRRAHSSHGAAKPTYTRA